MTSEEISKAREAAIDRARDAFNPEIIRANAQIAALFEIAFHLAKMNERFEADAKVFNEMVEKGKSVSA